MTSVHDNGLIVNIVLLQVLQKKGAAKVQCHAVRSVFICNCKQLEPAELC